MSEYTKRERTMKYTEIVYYVDGQEIDFVRNHNDWTYDESPDFPMTQEEIEDYT